MTVVGIAEEFTTQPIRSQHCNDIITEDVTVLLRRLRFDWLVVNSSAIPTTIKALNGTHIHEYRCVCAFD